MASKSCSFDIVSVINLEEVFKRRESGNGGNSPAVLTSREVKAKSHWKKKREQDRYFIG